MKNIIYIIIAFATVLASCTKDVLDINENPNLPPSGNLDLLLSGAQIAAGFWTARDANNIAMVISNQSYDLNYSQYAVSPDDINNDWDGLYTSALKEFQQVIEQGTAEGRIGIAGIAKVYKAYLFSIMVDVWGDIPYSEALQGETNTTPVFDNDENIYTSLLSLIDEAKANLDSAIANDEAEPSGDLIYTENHFARYKKVANTVKLRMLVNLRLVNPSLATSQIQALLTENNLINNNSENFVFRFGSTVSPSNRHPLYQEDYTGTGEGRTFYMNNWFMYCMAIKNDPRLRYYILRQAKFSDLDFQTTPCATRTDCDYANLIQDEVDAGNQIFEGLIGRDIGDPSGIPGDGLLRATWGVYPVGGIYDDGNGFINDEDPYTATQANGAASGGSGAGIMPWLTSANTHFLLAEAVITLGLPGDAEALFQKGIFESLKFVGEVSTGLDANAVPLDTMGADSLSIRRYVEDRVAEFNEPDQKLSVLTEEKLFAEFGNGWDAFTDVRRLGAPVTTGRPAPKSIVPLGPEPLRLPLSRSEITTNPNAPTPSPLVNERIFWDID